MSIGVRAYYVVRIALAEHRDYGTFVLSRALRERSGARSRGTAGSAGITLLAIAVRFRGVPLENDNDGSEAR